MVDTLPLSISTVSAPFGKDQHSLVTVKSVDTDQMTGNCEDRLQTPELSEDDAVSFQTTDSPRNVDALDITERPSKRPRFDSMLGLECELLEVAVISDKLPSDDDLDSLLEGLHQVWTDDEEKMISRSYDYLISHSGKDIRKRVLAAFNVWLQIEPQKLEIINRVVGMLHNASLLIDDIQDNSTLRRGASAAHVVYGTAQTINSANYVYFQAMQELYALGSRSHEALNIYCEEMLNLHRGQGMDLYWRDEFTLPTEEAYMKMISNKTGGLFRLAVRLMCAVSTYSYDFMPLVEKIGLIFQIRDDYKNLCSNEYNTAKGYCEDLTEGKFSFLIIHAIKHSPLGDNRILDILQKKTEDVELKDFVVDFMRNTTKTFEYTESVLGDLHRDAMAEIAVFGVPNPLLVALLEKLAA